MSLTALGQRLLSKASELFGDDDNRAARARNAANINALQQFGIFNFGNNGGNAEQQQAANDTALQSVARRVAAQNPNAAQNAAANVNLSGNGNTPPGYVRVAVTLPHNYPTPKEEAQAILVGLKYKAADIEAYDKYYGTDIVRNLSVGLGKDVDHNAGRRVYSEKLGKDVYVGTIAIDQKTHNHLKGFLDARRAGQLPPPPSSSNAAANNAAKSQANTAAKSSSNIKLDPVTVTVTAGGAGSVLVKTMPWQVGTKIVPRAVEALPKTASAVTLATEAATPVAAIAAEALPTVLIANHTAQLYQQGKAEAERKQAAMRYDAAREAAKATTLQMKQDDAGEVPQMQPIAPTTTGKAKERPFAEPVAPTVPNIGTAPPPKTTDLAPTSNAAPQTTVKPQTKIDELPQPETPDAPRNLPPQQQPPPRGVDPRLVPPTIIAGGAAGKAISDATRNDATNNTANQVFTGTLRNEPVELRDVEIREIQYTKRSNEAREKLRADFGRKNGARESFLKTISSDPDKLSQLKKAGFSDAQIEGIKIGRVPSKWQVHHKLPLDDGGDNSFGNLVLIKNDPYHLTITNEQSAQTRTLKPGETKTLNWVIPPGFVYPQNAKENK